MWYSGYYKSKFNKKDHGSDSDTEINSGLPQSVIFLGVNYLFVLVSVLMRKEE